MKTISIASVLLIFVLVGCSSQGLKNEPAASDTLAKNSLDKSVAGGAGILVIKEVVFGADAVVPDAVKNECELTKRLSAEIRVNAAKNYARVLEGTYSASANPQADMLTVEIINLVAPGGGAWSGGKSLMIKGSLSRDGKDVASFKALRVSMGGVFGGYMGTCAILDRCSKTLGEDVADWLQNPIPDAKLGNM